ncbi:MAG TPA: HPr-rel-A system PqqD family peptide chaperone [Chromatiales bacterium]|nr:HPr-rel-A system PqqD family peptide chaperone [Chromatiales bacterium]
MIESARWRATQGFDLHWKSWDDEHVVYSDGSGDTHLLNDFGAFVLKALIKNERTLEDLVKYAAESFKQYTMDDLRDQVSDLLLELDRLGVIERIHR